MRSISWLVTIVTILILPLAGVHWVHGELSFLFQFPPVLGRVEHAQFEFKLTLLILLLLPGTVILWHLLKRRDRIYRHRLILKRRHFPNWGYGGYILMIAAWIVAWNRFEPLSTIQVYTFTPLWLGFIVVVNAHVHRLSNTAPLYKSPAKFGLLFLLSAGFWWIFEYLNRFTENWNYVGVDGISATHYYIHGTICFSTVLPAVFSVFRLLNCFEGLHYTFYLGPRLSGLRSRVFGFSSTLAGMASMAGVGMYPQYCYPFLWLGPLLLFSGMQSLMRKRTGLGSWARGDWRWISFWSMAGLICGFWWECWNFFSLLKWEYSLSFFNGLPVFEMPILGYLGYLPFGVFCGLVVQILFPKRASIEFTPG